MAKRGIARLGEVLQRRGDAAYQGKPTEYAAQVVETITDSSTGKVTAIRARLIEGGAEVEVPVPVGTGVRGGNIVALAGPLNNPTAPLAFVRIDYSDDPTAGYGDNGTATPPTWADPAFATAIVASPGMISAALTVFWVAVEDRFRPTGYLVSWRVVGGQWSEVGIIPHLGGTQQCALGPIFTPGTDVEVRVRAYYAWIEAENGRYSVPTPTRVFTVAVDNATPGAATGLAVDTTVPGQAVLTATGTINRNLYDGWQYELATSPTGPATSISPPLPGAWAIPLPSGVDYYARVLPRSKAGVLGSPFPASGFQGPFRTVATYSPDTTPPDAFLTAPTVADTSYVDPQNVWRGRVWVQLPNTYSFALDYARTIVRIQNTTTGVVYFVPIEGTALGPIEVEVGAGTIKVDAVGVDTTGNRRATYGPQATIVLTAPWLPTGTLAVTVTTKALGLLVSWSGIVGATFYQVWRSVAVDGSGAVLVGRTDGESFFDPLPLDTVVAPTYYYQVRSYNNAGAGPVSTPTGNWVGGTASKVDGQNIRLGSLTADLVASKEGFFNDLIATGVTLATIIRTGDPANAATSQYIEMRGKNAGNPNQIALYEKIGGTFRQRSLIDGTGFSVFGDDAVSDITMKRNASGQGELNAGNGRVTINRSLVTLRSDLVPIRWQVANGNYVTVQATVLPTTANGSLVFSPNPTLLASEPEAPPISVANGAGYLSFSGYGITGGLNDGTFRLMSLRPVFGALGNYAKYWSMSDALNVRDIQTDRGNNTGVVFLGNARNAYLFFDGTRHHLANPAGYGLNIQNGYGPPPYQNNGLLTGAVSTLGAVANAEHGQPYFTFSYPTNGNNMTIRMAAIRGPAPDAGWADARFRLFTHVDNVVGLGEVQLGSRGNTGFVGLLAGGDTKLFVSNSGTTILGALSKPAGSFVIPHPDPAKTERWELRHCFVEGPTRGENIYTYVVTVGDDGKVSVVESEGQPVAVVAGSDGESAYADVPLPDYWPHLNERPRVVASLDGDSAGWGQAKGSVSADLATLRVRWSAPGVYNLVLYGTRKDPAARDWWDRRGVQKTTVQEWVAVGTQAKWDARTAIKAAAVERAAADAERRANAPIVPRHQLPPTHSHLGAVRVKA